MHLLDDSASLLQTWSAVSMFCMTGFQQSIMHTKLALYCARLITASASRLSTPPPQTTALTIEVLKIEMLCVCAELADSEAQARRPGAP